MKNKTKAILRRVLKDSEKFSYRYKIGLFKRKWIDLYDVITIIHLIRTEKDLNKLTLEVLLRLEVQLDDMIKKKVKSLPFKGFRIIIETAIKSIVL